ncbi:hypothetical protein [Maricaulis sp.]|uniref:hypothetical protein n=1 Tax=Maricaulis sp. TaxID=1486257 RepID=UPI003A941AA7
MFIGHYAPAFLGKRIAKTVPLWVLFAAVQLVDIAWGAFIATGIEHVRIIEGFTASNSLDLYDMPWTHSLVMALVWSLGAGWLWSLIARKDKKLGGIVVGAAVFSHWLTDLIVHVPDLLLYPGSDIKFGFGLWNNFPIAMGLELTIFLGSMAIYLTGTRAKGMAGRIWPLVATALMLGLFYLGMTNPPPEDLVLAGSSAVVMYLLICAIAAGFDLTREAK